MIHREIREGYTRGYRILNYRESKINNNSTVVMRMRDRNERSRKSATT